MTEWLIEISYYVQIFGGALLIVAVGYPWVRRWRSDPSSRRPVVIALLALAAVSIVAAWIAEIVRNDLSLPLVIVAMAAGVALAPHLIAMDRRLERDGPDGEP